MSKKNRRKTSKGGRPRQPGERYACGKLKPPAPNELALERRRQLCADITMATNPLDAAYANNWLTLGQHKAGMAYARAYRQAGFGGAGRAAGADLEVETGTGVEKRAISAMSRKEIAAVFDAVFNDAGPGDQEARELRAAMALDLWGAMNARMSPEVRFTLQSVCIDQSFPQWLIMRAAGRAWEDIPERWARPRALLTEGLRVVSATLREQRAQHYANLGEPEAPAIFLEPEPERPSGRKVEEVVHYVGEDGEPDPVMSRGNPVEVVRRRRA